MKANASLFRAIRFGLIGGLASATYAAVMLACVHIADMRPEIASVLGYLAGIPVSFIGQKHFTFRSRQRALPEVVRFIIVQAVNVASSYALMYAITSILGLSHWIGIVVVIIGSATLTYVLLKTFVFLHLGPQS